jgi:hypothetical protein
VEVDGVKSVDAEVANEAVVETQAPEVRSDGFDLCQQNCCPSLKSSPMMLLPSTEEFDNR